MNQLPGLLKQEKEALSVYLSLVYTSYTKYPLDSEMKAKLLNKFIE